MGRLRARACLVFLLTARCSAIKETSANAESKAWLEAYAADPESVVKESGLMYKVLTAGGGGDSPGPQTPCKCHYEGRTVANYPDGPAFDSSYARGKAATFAPKQVIRAWTEAMQIMTPGAKWEIVCPPEVAYGRVSKGDRIPANSVLVFTMEMLSCKAGGGGGPRGGHHKREHA